MKSDNNTDKSNHANNDDNNEQKILMGAIKGEVILTMLVLKYVYC